MDETLEKDRINKMVDAVMKVARGDYSTHVELSGKNDDLDSLAMGLNMMIDDTRTGEEVLQKSEEKYRGLVSNVKLGIFRSTPGPDGKFLEVNPAMEELTGYSRKELLQMSVFNLYVHSEERETILEEVASAIGKTTKEIYFRKKDGAEMIVSDTKVAVRDDSGAILCFDGILEDITERKRMEHALNERVKELQCLYNIAYIAERPGITLDELCQEVVSLLPAGWQYPEITCARVTLGDREFKTDNFKTTEWKLSTNIKVKGQKEGTIEVHYLEAKQGFDEGPFLKEERLLIDAVAERLGRITERQRVEEALRSFNKLAVGRELRMIELKKEINIILQKLGEEPRYEIVEENETKLNK